MASPLTVRSGRARRLVANIRLEILSGAGDFALLLRQNSKTFISVRQIMLPSAVTRILINQFAHNLERALVLLLGAVQIAMRYQQIAEPIVANRPASICV